MNLADAIASFSGATKELKEATAALTAAQADNAALTARVAELEPVAARVPDLESNLLAITAERDAAQARVAELEAKEATFNQRVTEAANAEAAKIVASAGHAPVATATKSGDEGTPTDPKARALKNWARK